MSPEVIFSENSNYVCLRIGEVDKMSKEKGKERAVELAEEFIALMLKTNFSFNTNIAIRPIKIVLCPLVKGNGFKSN